MEAGKRGGEGGHLDVVGVLDEMVGRSRRYPGTKGEELKPGSLKGYIFEFKILGFLRKHVCFLTLLQQVVP